MNLHRRHDGPRGRILSDLETLELLYEVGNRCARLGSDVDRNVDMILDAAIRVTDADKGMIQLYDAASGVLVIAAQRGHERPFLDFFSRVDEASDCACGAALGGVQRVLVEDATRSEIFAGKPTLDVLLAAGVCAGQATPLVSSTDKVLGVVSTHFRKPTRLTDRQLRFLDLLIRQAADYLERKQNEQALKAKQDQLERITGTAPVLISQCSRDLRYVFVNKAYAEFAGKPVEHIIGRKISEVLGEVYFERIRPHIERVLAGEPFAYENEIVHPTKKTTHYMQVACVPGVDSRGVVDSWVATLSDITERRRAEQRLRDADRHKDEFLAMLAHELRNPLAPISADVETLQRSSDTETVQSTLTSLGRHVGHMARLVDDLLDVSRVSLGKIELKSERIDLRTVVEQAVHNSRSLIESMQHRLTVSVPPEPLYVRADSVRLVQALCNLMHNACKFMATGGSIVLTLQRVIDEAVVRVQDRGIGLASQDIPRIFELFAQLDTSRQRSVGGLGVGLTLARTVVEKHGGTVDAYSEGPGQGSEFVVRLPLSVEEAPRRDVSSAEPSLTAQRRILIVEDNQETATALARLLRTGGHTTHTAYDGPQAVEAARELRPEIVLLDIGLPILDGYATCRSIRREPWGKEMMLVALSGYGQTADVQDAQAAGFDHYLLKPVSYRTLARVFAGLPCKDDKLAVAQ
jgi:PAS domain S-box-containing protein